MNRIGLFYFLLFLMLFSHCKRETKISFCSGNVLDQWEESIFDTTKDLYDVNKKETLIKKDASSYYVIDKKYLNCCKEYFVIFFIFCLLVLIFLLKLGRKRRGNDGYLI
ncbi:hypothetical protein EHP00_789 [Ecytonucleospora hepatopenaei]|uniref:Uncharacterized protein n=1 Tax=Ecytonucleospora hepatopenaei TaxID=646526 RepID=A0A1W0E7T1_9MICR|nr:hypothetical protein EHP00_789 [Ecytonucleospora hepatopenaei]